MALNPTAYITSLMFNGGGFHSISYTSRLRKVWVRRLDKCPPAETFACMFEKGAEFITQPKDRRIWNLRVFVDLYSNP